MQYTGSNYIQEKIKRRAPEAHKGNFGRVLICAGSPGMAGAAVLCGRAALKSGAGLVRFLLPSLDDPIYPILQTAVPEATCVSYMPGMDFSVYTSIAAGSGLGSDSARLGMLSRIVENYKGVLVLDADALNLMSTNSHLASLVHNSQARIILTPHGGEAKRLLGIKPGEMFSISHPQAREDVAKSLVEKYNSIVVLKGAHTIVAESSEKGINMYENTTGNPGMATGGSGDALTGLIASLAGQDFTPVDAARVGAFIHGLAGDLAAQDVGEMGMTALDITNQIPYALKVYYK